MSATTRPSPTKQSSTVPPRKRRHSAIEQGAADRSEDEDPDDTHAGAGNLKGAAAAAAAAATTAATTTTTTTAGGRRRGAKAAAWNSAGVDLATVGHAVEYRYTTEISQMIYVFCEIQEPVVETVHLIEDIVRGQLIELITRARLTSHLRASRYLAPEDLIFLIRDDRAKVNRLRTYLSWKEVRKNAKKDDQAARGGADIEVEDLDDVVEKKQPKKQVIKLPWELITPFQDLLRNLPNWTTSNEDEDNDDEELEAYEDSIQRLREADAVTRRMTKEQYVFYSECRQASFTYRKSKRFKDFINASAFLDVKPNEDVMDILGFLAFEMVRTLCMAALELRNRAASITRADLESERVEAERTFRERQEAERLEIEERERAEREAEEQRMQEEKAKREQEEKEKVDGLAEQGEDGVEGAKPTEADAAVQSQDVDMGSPSKPATTDTEPAKAPPAPAPTPAPHTSPKKPSKQTAAQKLTGIAALLPPPTASQAVPLLSEHILGAYAAIQREQAMKKNGGLRNWTAGAPRSRAKLL
ncbi:hypothetical protein NliqN6_0379 [Naganishia liquefaciens]|uniref:Transcription initiation protein SPT3 n=1 Tax=Naganishia liquefaciens TaxID=104408 RepID=A0A8H3TMW1_9TREE|nr:hypothetical protein NliqN6_0379 [Naganishia liquefaciens]